MTPKMQQRGPWILLRDKIKLFGACALKAQVTLQAITKLGNNNNSLTILKLMKSGLNRNMALDFATLNISLERK